MTNPQSIYEIPVIDNHGLTTSLLPYKGKVLLIVNTATECGFTPQLQGLENLYQTYHSKGFEVLAFPSNDFGSQEPRNGAEIENFCQLNYHTTFPFFEKIQIKGSARHPLYQFLTSRKIKGGLNIPPQWNFHKYLVNQEGIVTNSFLTFIQPQSKRIEKALNALL